MNKSERQLQVLGTFVHGSLAAFHGLGIVYNATRRNWRDVAVHTAAFTYDIWCTKKHFDAAKKKPQPYDYGIIT